MSILILALWLAGAVQLAIAFANFVLAGKLDYRRNLARVAPIIRQIFVVHSAYIVGIVLLFAVITFGFASDLAGGHGLGRFLAGAIALFWLCRIPVQFFYYEKVLRREHRAGDVAITVAMLFLAATYATAVLV